MFSSWWQKNDGVDPASGSAAGGVGGFVTDQIEPESEGLVLGAGSFRLFKGHVKSSGKPISVFKSEAGSGGVDLTSAVQGLKRIKTLRHPSVVTFIDAHETSKAVVVATEAVVPLLAHLAGDGNAFDDDYKTWGVMQVFRAVGFMHSAGLVHGCLHSGCVFVTDGLEWKIFGFEMTRMVSEGTGISNTFPGEISAYSPPDADCTIKFDVWGLGTILWEVFNGKLSSRSQLGKLGRIPEKLTPTYMSLVAKVPSKRPDINECLKNSNLFHNDLISTMTFLEEFQIKDEGEKSRFFSTISQKLDKFPPQLCTNKILPELIKMFDFGNAGAQILQPVFKIGKSLSTEKYQEVIVPCLVKLFASSDRNARYKLLCQLENFVEHLSNKMVNEQVFPQIQNGFTDQQPVIREKTVIAVIHLAPKLSFANLDECVIMKHFSKLLRDEQPGIRTNTTVCLGKVARHLHYQTRQKVLSSAFGVKLKDPFPPARIAAINSFAATQQYYNLQETSSKVLPMICTLMTDPEKPVRDQAFKVARGFMQKLEQVSEDPSLKEEMETMVTKNEASSSTTATTVSSWASWAVGAIGAKFYKSSMKPPQLPSENATKETVPSPPSSAMKLAKKSTEESLIDLEEEKNGWNNEDVEDNDNDAWESLETEKSDDKSGGWDDWGQDGPGKVNQEEEEAKKKREAKRLARQKEIEAKRAARKGGAMKLGSRLS